MGTIRAAVCHAFGAPLVVEDLDLRAPRGREVEVTLSAVAICHSDITYASGDWGGALPAVYGHEASGRVTALGPDARGVAIGDTVIVSLIRACGSCPSCSGGRTVACETPIDPDETPLRTLGGDPVVQAMATGGFAEKVVVDQSQISPIPGHVPMASAALLACGVITGVGAVVNAARLRAGQDVVVIGAGGVGLNAIQGARIAGARRIVAVDMTEEKLADARAFGATDGVLASQDTPWREAKAIMGRGADAVIVTVGVVAAYNAAPRYLAAGGMVVMVGMPQSDAEAQYVPVNFASAGQSMVGSKMGDAVLARDIPWLIDLYGQGRLELDALVSKTWSLDQINEAIADTRAGSARRNVIVF